MTVFFGNGRKYAVLGASASRFKFGNRILKWYIRHDLEVIPINPRVNKVCDIRAYKSLNEYFLNNEVADKSISVSVVTAPNVSYELFKEVKDSNNENKIASVWFQPGSYDSRVVDFVREEIGIHDDDAVICDGECILVSGVTRMRTEMK